MKNLPQSPSSVIPAKAGIPRGPAWGGEIPSPSMREGYDECDEPDMETQEHPTQLT